MKGKRPSARAKEGSVAPRGSRVPLSRDQVLREAIGLADGEGLDSLTMRELGKRLGVEAMSLYNHVRGKDEVLDGMLDLVVAEIEAPALDEEWRPAMRRRAISAREAFARHPWAAALIDSRMRSGPERLRYLDSIIGSLRRGGFSIELAASAFSLIDSYIYGFARQRGNMASRAAASDSEAAREFLEALPSAEYPYLAQMAAMQADSGYDEAGDFEFGLELILDGLERLLPADPEGPGPALP
jgi:AcrR family transcriptional regulator